MERCNTRRSSEILNAVLRSPGPRAAEALPRGPGLLPSSRLLSGIAAAGRGIRCASRGYHTNRIASRPKNFFAPKGKDKKFFRELAQRAGQVLTRLELYEQW